MKIVLDFSEKSGNYITYNKKLFKDYIELQNYMILKEDYIKEILFPYSRFMYIKNLLENKFKRKYSIDNIKEHLAKALNKEI